MDTLGKLLSMVFDFLMRPFVFWGFELTLFGIGLFFLICGLVVSFLQSIFS